MSLLLRPNNFSFSTCFRDTSFDVYSKKLSSFAFIFFIKYQLFQITQTGCARTLVCFITWIILFETVFKRYRQVGNFYHFPAHSRKCIRRYIFYFKPPPPPPKKKKKQKTKTKQEQQQQQQKTKNKKQKNPKKHRHPDTNQKQKKLKMLGGCKFWDLQCYVYVSDWILNS